MDAMDGAILQYHGKETGNVSFEFSFEFSNENLCDEVFLQYPELLLEQLLSE